MKAQGCGPGKQFNPKTWKCERFVIDQRGLPIFAGDKVVPICDMEVLSHIAPSLAKQVKLPKNKKVTAVNIDVKKREIVVATGKSKYKPKMSATDFHRASIPKNERDKIRKRLAKEYAKQDVPIPFEVDSTGLIRR